MSSSGNSSCWDGDGDRLSSGVVSQFRSGGQFDDATLVGAPDPIAASTCEQSRHGAPQGGDGGSYLSRNSSVASTFGLLDSGAMRGLSGDLLDESVGRPAVEAASTGGGDDEAEVTQDVLIDRTDLAAFDDFDLSELDNGDGGDAADDAEEATPSADQRYFTASSDFARSLNGAATSVDAPLSTCEGDLSSRGSPPRDSLGGAEGSPVSRAASAFDRFSLGGASAAPVNPFDSSDRSSAPPLPFHIHLNSGDDAELQDDFNDTFTPRDEDEKLRLMNEDEVEFAELHRFELPEAASLATANTSSWSVHTDDAPIARPAWFSTVCADNDASKLSPSALFVARSGALGDLSHRDAAMRPFWGTSVTSPASSNQRQPSRPASSRAGDKTTSVVDELSNASDDEEGLGAQLNSTAAGDVAQLPIVSTPLPPAGRGLLAPPRLGLPAFSALSAVSSAEHDNTHMRRPKESAATDCNSRLFSRRPSSSTPLSLSAIQRCLGDASVGANASALAEVIMKAKSSMRNKATTKPPESAVRPSFVEQPSARAETPPSRVAGVLSDGAAPGGDVRRRDVLADSSAAANASEMVASAELKSTAALESNKSAMLFGCVAVGASVAQATTIKNSSGQIMSLRVLLRRAGRGFFLPDADKDSGEANLLLSPGELLALRVVFKPDCVGCFSNRVRLETRSGSIKFAVSLLGYGGVGAVTVDSADAVKRRGAYLLPVGENADGSWRRAVRLRNSGERAAFVRLSQAESDGSKRRLSVYPSAAVLKVGESKDVVFSADSLQSADGAATDSAISVFWSEEILRQRLQLLEGERGKPLLAHGITFTGVRFCGEEDSQPLPAGAAVSSADYRLFVGALRRFTLNFAGSGGDASSLSTTFLGRTVQPEADASSVAAKRSRMQQSTPIREKAATEPSSTEGAPFGVSSGHVTVCPTSVRFVRTKVDAWDSTKVEFRNLSRKANTIQLRILEGPFAIKCPEYRLDPMKFVRIAVYFEPKSLGEFDGSMQVDVCDQPPIVVPLRGLAV